VTYLLLKNPRVLAKLQDEIRSTFNSDEEINFDSCNRLEYCLAVLTEALRVYPPVPGGLPRIVDAQGDMIEGHWVPGGVSDFLALGEETCSYWRSAWQVTIFANLRYLL
jgi:cytochrome P450